MMVNSKIMFAMSVNVICVVFVLFVFCLFVYLLLLICA